MSKRKLRERGRSQGRTSPSEAMPTVTQGLLQGPTTSQSGHPRDHAFNTRAFQNPNDSMSAVGFFLYLRAKSSLTHLLHLESLLVNAILT